MTTTATKLEYLHLGNPFTDVFLSVEESVLGSEFNWAESIWPHRLKNETASFNEKALIEISDECPELQLSLLFSEKLDNSLDKVSWFTSFSSKAKKLSIETPDQQIAFLAQRKKAYNEICSAIYGSSRITIEFRANLWKLLFGTSMIRYREQLQSYIDKLPRLVIGEEGTERLEVAKILANNKFRAFDSKSKSFIHGSTSCSIIDLAELSDDDAYYTFSSSDESPSLFDDLEENETLIIDSIELASDRLRAIFKRQITAARNGFVIFCSRSQQPEMSLPFVEIPPLRRRFSEDANELKRIVWDIHQSELISETLSDLHYNWPGNVQELKGAVNQVLLQGKFIPIRNKPSETAFGDNSPYGEFLTSNKTLQELEREYTLYAYQNVQSYEGAAKLLNVDWRTVKAKLESFE